MRVVTLDKEQFDSACVQLGEKMVNDSEPVAIIGVLTGGSIVAKNIYASLLGDLPELKYFDISASRTSSIAKRKINVGRLFRMLPGYVLNLLRVFEHYHLRFIMRFRAKFERHVQLNTLLRDYLEDLSDGCVYIVDDAIDSGSTIEGVVTMLKDINSKLNYKIAALVITQNESLVSPDVSLYQNVLIRFPWSSDYKND